MSHPAGRPPSRALTYAIVAFLAVAGLVVVAIIISLVLAKVAGPAQPADIEVRLVGAHVGSVTWADRFGGWYSSTSDALEIHVSISNNSKSLLRQHESWLGGGASLTDDLGNSYSRIRAPLGRYLLSGEVMLPATVSIHPQDSFIDMVLFERPVRQARTFTLTLQRRNFGGRGRLELSFPMPRH